jgi:hypothetical protein
MKNLIFFLSLLSPVLSYAGSVDKKALNCVLTTVKIETNNQTMAAKQGIVNVIKNRINDRKKHNKNATPCSIISEKGQFAKSSVIITDKDRELAPVVEKIFNNSLPDNTNGALFFNDRWGGCPSNGRVVAKHDDMLFCNIPGTKKAKLKQTKLNRIKQVRQKLS